jgi:hypothetical protein
METNTEFGWLLDDGRLCLGASDCSMNFMMVTYTDPNAIRFSRKRDALLMRRVLKTLQIDLVSPKLEPVEHGWG